MKRFGEKAMREALENGAVIREWEWFAGGGYRVIIDGEGAGYITESLFCKLKEDGTIEKARQAHSFADYASPAATTEEATKEKTEEEWNAESERVHAATLAALPDVAKEETEKERTDRENREHCKRIAEELEQYTDGNVYRCTECGELCTIEEAEDEDGFTVYKTSCGCTLDYEPDQMSAYDFIADALDIEVSCSLDREYRSARIMVACGGPNIYIDTARKAVELYWWTDRAEYPISSSAADALDEAIAEYWEVR